jgi:hypothetical protein
MLEVAKSFLNEKSYNVKCGPDINFFLMLCEVSESSAHTER